ncbi:MAG: serine/threonine-protein kinase [Planctomycetota bacterium]|nr:serine/threonine-protein kinase [Planctomycetota bacterium]
MGLTGHRVGDYELPDALARGGMGVVYRARHLRLDRIVALKMILSGGQASSEERRRFSNESAAAARLQHPAIVPIFEVGQHADQPFFAMAFIDGSNLRERLSSGSIPPSDAARLVRILADAVHYAHAQGVVHRDLKPANILLDSDGQPHITDFGLAKQSAFDGELTDVGQIIGTPAYMSPEQATGKSEQVGPAADVYSLGAILYHALTGRSPFLATPSARSGGHLSEMPAERTPATVRVGAASRGRPAELRRRPPHRSSPHFPFRAILASLQTESLAHLDNSGRRHQFVGWHSSRDPVGPGSVARPRSRGTDRRVRHPGTRSSQPKRRRRESERLCRQHAARTNIVAGG